MRSMALLAVLIGCGVWLWAKYDPWVLAYVTPETHEGWLRRALAYVTPGTHEEPLRVLGLSADGARVVTLSWTGAGQTEEEKRVWVRDCRSLRPLVRLQDAVGYPKRATFALNGTHVLLLDRHDDLLRVFDASSGRTACLYRGHVEGYPVHEEGNYPFVLYAVFSPDGQRVASWYEGGERRGVHVWEATTGKRLFFLPDAAKYRDTVEWSRDGKQLVAMQRSGPTAAWDAQTGERLHVVDPVDARSGYVECFRCVDEGIRALVCNHEPEQMSIFEVETGRTLCVLERAPSEIEEARFSPDGRKLVLSDRDFSYVAWWDAENGQPLGRMERSGGELLAMQFSSDGQRLITIDDKGAFRIHDAASGDLLTQVELEKGDWRAYALLSRDGTAMSYYEGSWAGDETLWLRRRPEWWWGVFWLPAFWLSALLGAAFLYSLCRDARKWLRRDPTQPNASSSLTGSQATP